MVPILSKFDFYALTQSAVIDLRNTIQFIERHLKNSCNIIASDLVNRLHELPESSQKISLIGDINDIIKAEIFLNNKGYEVLFKLDSDVFFTTYKNYNWFESGNTRNRLWKPSSVVTRFVENSLAIHSDENGCNKDDDFQLLTGIDLACGAGRDSVFMAINQWEMTAVDYLSSALERVEILASNNHCDVQTVKFDLEKTGTNGGDIQFPRKWLSYFNLVILSRYLHRPLLKHLDSLLKPGGFIVYQTFLEGSEKFGSPKNPRYLLKSGELANVFSSYEILYNEVEKLADGRPTNAFIAQKQNLIDIIN